MGTTWVNTAKNNLYPTLKLKTYTQKKLLLLRLKI